MKEIFCGVIFIVLFLIFLRRVMKIWEIDQENEMMQGYMDVMQEFYRGIQEKIEVTRKYRHDLAKHIQMLEMILEKDQLDNAYHYMNSLKVQYDLLERCQFCSDEIVDVTLHMKKKQCEEKQIPMEIQVEDTIYHEIQEVDMVGLLHNLLDNAMEANERIPEIGDRGIWFHMYKNEDAAIVIEMKNRILQGEKVSFQTKKRKKEDHGIGTKIIETIVKKYNGNRNWKVNDSEMIFEDRIVLQSLHVNGGNG